MKLTLLFPSGLCTVVHKGNAKFDPSILSSSHSTVM